jgi:two-component system response regulator FlrC
LQLPGVSVSAILTENLVPVPLPVRASAAPQVVFGDPFMAQLLALAGRVARTEVTVLIGGPSGTGKEVLARYIHDRSLRKGENFVAFNCACLPESMVEDLLFGHEKGAFTGATQRFEGFFEQADGGTLFLDEVGELPLSVQAKLLRVLQEREFTPLGATRPVKTRFRLLAATNRNLLADVQSGRFREDLYYRLNIFPLQLKPLRQRPGDIVPLARAMLERHNYIAGEMRLDESAIAALLAHEWPGNVRELENVIQRAMVVAEGDTVSAHHLGLDASLPQDMGAATVVTMAVSAATESQSLLSRAEPEPDASLASRRVIQEAELILETLKASPTKTSAAARLGISERTLRYKLARMREHGLVAAEL